MSRSKCCVTMMTLTAALTVWFGAAAGGEEDDGFKPIFNGQSLDEWAGDESVWRVEDGMIVGQTTEEQPLEANTFLVWEGGKPADFELRFRFRITSDHANSGVQVRSERLDDAEGYVVGGYQPDIATDDWITGILYEERGRGILVRRGQKAVYGADGSKQVTRFADEEALAEAFDLHDWTNYHITAQGNKIVTKINGQTVHVLIDDAPQARRDGVIAFQLHTGPPMTIQFKDIQLKQFASAGADG